MREDISGVDRLGQSDDRTGKSVIGPDRGSSRAKILRVALALFGTEGFDGTSIGDIAQRCAVSTPLVHYHFSSKIDLWKQAVAVGMADVLRELALPTDDGLDPVAEFETFLRRYIAYLAREPHIFLIIVKESDVRSARFVWLRETYLERFYALWGGRIRALGAAGRLRVAGPDYQIALVGVGACQHFLTSRHRVLPFHGEDELDPALVLTHAELVVDILMKGMIKREE